MKMMLIIAVIVMLWGTGRHDFAAGTAETFNNHMTQTVRDQFTLEQANILSSVFIAAADVIDPVMTAIATVATQDHSQEQPAQTPSTLDLMYR